MSEETNGYIRWRDLDEREQRIMLKLDHLGDRVDTLEGVIDQQRGARALVYFLIGSNLLAVAAVVWGVIK